MIKLQYFLLIFVISSCSVMRGPDGFFPETKYDFLEEEVEEGIALPGSLSSPNVENHYPVVDLNEIGKFKKDLIAKNPNACDSI